MAVDPNVLASAFKPHLEPGEELRQVAYGVKPPPLLLILVLCLIALIPGVIASHLLVKHYIVGLTNRRLIALRFTGGKQLRVREIIEYSLSDLPPVKASTGTLFTQIKITDQNRPLKLKFHRMGMQGNRDSAMAIAATLTGQNRLAQAAIPAPQRAPISPTAETARPAAPDEREMRAVSSTAATALRFEIGSVTLRLAPGLSIEPMQLGRAGAGRGKAPIAEIAADPSEPGGLGLRNLSDRVYRAKLPTGKTIDVSRGEVVRLAPGVVIDFGGIEGIVQAK